jgi:hypothetical protein
VVKNARFHGCDAITSNGARRCIQHTLRYCDPAAAYCYLDTLIATLWPGLAREAKLPYLTNQLDKENVS